MPTVITVRNKTYVIQNADRGRSRWARPPFVPELCYTCYDLKTLEHYPATGYAVDRAGWRYGVCERCRDKMTPEIEGWG
jgi:hypothetical protein